MGLNHLGSSKKSVLLNPLVKHQFPQEDSDLGMIWGYILHVYRSTIFMLYYIRIIVFYSGNGILNQRMMERQRASMNTGQFYVEFCEYKLYLTVFFQNYDYDNELFHTKRFQKIRMPEHEYCVLI